MLSRRFLRIKVMQTLYALKQAQLANYQLALDLIVEDFKPDLNSMERPDLRKLEGLRKMANLTFEELALGKTIDTEDTPKEAEKSARGAFKYYQDRNASDLRIMSKITTEEPQRIFNNYIKFLLAFIEIADEAIISDQWKYYNDAENEITQGNKYKAATFDNNRVIQALRACQALKVESIRHHINWDADRLMLRKFVKDTLIPEENFTKYCQQTNHTLEEDRLIIWHIFKMMLRSDLIDNYFAEKDLYWDENADVVTGIIKRTLKLFENQGDIEIQALSPSWEDDKYFFEDLLRYTIEKDKQYEEWVINQVEKWDIERIAITDQVLLKMALAEMANFPSIPIKVTINEFIDLAKSYSTPKSGTFLNGILDVLSARLLNEGVIRKSGRGLIDNK
jgi:transcription antitermination protein NusB